MKKVITTILIIIFLTTVFFVFDIEETEAQRRYQIMEPIGGAPDTPSLAQYLSAAFDTGVALAAILTVVVLVIAGIMYISAAGNTGKIENAKNMIVQAILGLLLILISYLILQAINPTLVNQGFNITPCSGCISRGGLTGEQQAAINDFIESARNGMED